MPPRMTPIIDILDETPIHKTLYFKDAPCKNGQPGQFVMLWIPGVDEIPMSLSDLGDNQAVTIKKIGDATTKIFAMNPGDFIGLRGPYGTGFSKKGKSPLFIAGGTGIAPLYPLIKNFTKKTVALGAETASNLLFKEKILKSGANLYISTDDGSEGYNGIVIDLAKKLLETNQYDMIFTCGPEIMMAEVVHLALQFSLPVEVSLERWMKCGVGICDSCALNGFHVCKDGPVFNGEKLKKIKEFGKWQRASSGKKMPLI